MINQVIFNRGDLIVNFSVKLRQLRKEKRMSQEQIAEILNISRQSVSKWESGKSYPELDKLIVLSDLFEVTLDDLIREKEKTNNNNNHFNADDIDYEDEEKSEWFIIGGFMIGMAIATISGNYMWAMIGSLIGYGLYYVIQGIKNK